MNITNINKMNRFMNNTAIIFGNDRGSMSMKLYLSSVKTPRSLLENYTAIYPSAFFTEAINSLGDPCY